MNISQSGNKGWFEGSNLFVAPANLNIQYRFDMDRLRSRCCTMLYIFTPSLMCRDTSTHAVYGSGFGSHNQPIGNPSNSTLMVHTAELVPHPWFRVSKNPAVFQWIQSRLWTLLKAAATDSSLVSPFQLTGTRLLREHLPNHRVTSDQA